MRGRKRIRLRFGKSAISSQQSAVRKGRDRESLLQERRGSLTSPFFFAVLSVSSLPTTPLARFPNLDMTDDSHFRTKRSLRGERDSATSATEGVFLLTFRNEVLYNTGSTFFAQWARFVPLTSNGRGPLISGRNICATASFRRNRRLMPKYGHLYVGTVAHLTVGSEMSAIRR